eukprot:g13072.t1 g13072   contig7:820488-821499(+)
MLECKKALASPDVNNDLALAQEWLRKHSSQKIGSKVAGREALEGLVGVCIDNCDGGSRGVLVKVASETDFASRSEVFTGLVQEIADAAAAAAGDGGDIVDIPTFLANTQSITTGKLLSECLNDAVLSIRENIQLDSIVTIGTTPSSRSVIAGYVHGRAPNSTCGTSAALVEVEVLPKDGGGGDDAVLSEEEKSVAMEAAKKLAMHVVASNPLYLNPESVPVDVVEKEREILMEKMTDSNKPPEIIEKIISGQLRKFYEGICLTEQSHLVEEGNPKISKVMKGLGLVVKDFRLVGMSK